MRLWLPATALVLLAGLGVGGMVWWKSAVQQAGPLQTERAFVVPHGATRQVADALTANGVIDNPTVFRMAALLSRSHGALHAAEFAFPAHASIEQVLQVLRTAKPVEHHVTIPEGLTSRQIEAVLSHAEAMTGSMRPVQEGSVLPQTYDYEFGTDRDVLIGRAKAAMEKDLASAWADRAPGVALGSPRDAVILASIVERETARPEERSHIAAVYLNRLRQGMKLQADPTVVYAASGGSGVLDHPLTKAELGQDNPFNTYRSVGLPPAPICSPGLDSLHAVLHPADSDDLYFVADGTGGHVFSRDYQAHDAAVVRWRATLPQSAE